MLKWILSGLFALAGLIIVWCARQLAKLALAMLLYSAAHPRSTAALSAAGAAVYLLGPKVVIALVIFLYLSASTWQVAHRESFDRFIGIWVRVWWRKWWIYRRRWADVFTRCDLAVTIGPEEHVPKLVKVAATAYWDRLELEMQCGQEVGQFRDADEKLRHAFRAERMRVQEVRPGFVGLDFMRRDPLRYEPIPATAMPATTAAIDFSAVPVGLTEHLEPLTVSVLGGHLAVAGATGSGKAGVEWNLLRGLAPAIADGTVRPVFIDPKARELRQGRQLVRPEDYAVTAQETLALLLRLVAEMEQANDEDGANGERDFTPSPSRPLVLILIDELAPLLAYWPRSTRDKIEDALSLLLTQGRAAGYIVVGEIQEPTKDIFRVRDLFARRLALRVPTEAHTDAILTDNAVDRGAAAHEIPEDLPGVLYALDSGASAAIRGRLGHVTNDGIAELVEYVDQLRTVVQIDSRRAEQPAVAA